MKTEKRYQFRERLVLSNKPFEYKLREKINNEISLLEEMLKSAINYYK